MRTYLLIPNTEKKKNTHAWYIYNLFSRNRKQHTLSTQNNFFFLHIHCYSPLEATTSTVLSNLTKKK